VLKTSITLLNSTTSTAGSLTARGLGCNQSTPFSSVLVTARTRDRSNPHPHSPTVFKYIPKNNIYIVNYNCPGHGGRNQEAWVSCPIITVPCGVCRTRQLEHVAPQQTVPDGFVFISPLTWRSMQLQLHTLHSLWLMQFPRHCWCLGRFNACRSLLAVGGGGGRKSDKPYTPTVIAVSHIPSGLWASHSRFSSTVMTLICFHYRHHHNQYWRCVTKVTGFASFSSLICKFRVGLRLNGLIWRNQTPRWWETHVFFKN
jgi:hypothetical protein